MSGQSTENSIGRSPWPTAVVVGILAVAAVSALFFFFSGREQPQTQTPLEEPKPAVSPAEKPGQTPVVDFNRLDGDMALQQEMDKRKEKYGIKEGLDMVVREDEAVKIGDATVSMGTIREKSDLKKGRVVEKDLQNNRSVNKESVAEYGIHVVQPGENIWDIHFALLKDYFAGKGIDLSPLADEPQKNGTSSGVGKILKFSEHIVTIYNLKENKLEIDLNNIQPLERIVVYRMDGVFSLLDQVNDKDIKKLAFDGRTLWVPAETPALNE
jgi:hypothetical protein